MVTDNTQAVITRTERGLAVAGTRITLYDILDYLQAEWPPSLIRDWLHLTDRQIQGAVEYINVHRIEVEAEYDKVIKDNDASRAFWETKNRERFAQIASGSSVAKTAPLRAKLLKLKTEKGPPA